MALRFYNTLTKKTQSFRPVMPGLVRMYTCGPTVYDFAHVGNFRTYIFEDLLRRYLKYKGFQVRQVMNLTDVDDKTIKKARSEGVPLREVTDRYVKAFFEDLDQLNIERAEVYPRATEHIAEMTQLIQTLLKKGIAYKTPDNCIYYSIKKFRKYGQLAHIKVEELQAGASGRVLIDEYEKAQVADFALWKAWDPKDGEVGWETPLGKGRPGWHIECSAMSMKHLSEAFATGTLDCSKFQTIDIHTGGVDNIFPHHQNEIAQSEGCCRKRFVNYWLHSEHLIAEGKKMSKSLGNFYTLRDLLAKGYDAMTIRYLLLSVHYRQQLNLTVQGLDSAKAALQRLKDFVLMLQGAKGGADNPKLPKLLETAKKKFEKALDNDLDISPALAAIFVLVNKVNRVAEKRQLSEADAKRVLELMLAFDRVLGLRLEQLGKEELPEELKALIAEREHARAIKNWARADELREELQKRGIIVEDTAYGTRWKRILS